MKKFLIFIFFSCVQMYIQAQPLITRNGYIWFFSETPLEDIKAENHQVNAAIDPFKKTIAFAVLMKGFLFDKDLMQEHFNEHYIESDKYPKASFTGSYAGEVNLKQNGSYPIVVKGQLTLHGVTKTILIPATLDVQAGKLTGRAKFNVKPSDYKIKIPALVRDKIAQHIQVAVKVNYNL
ncbi:MAG: YceI family protein [Chitinophagaceae bacterium]